MNTKAYTIDENGFLYFGTVNGMVVMNPEKVLQWKKSHGFFINQVQVKYPNKIEVLKDFSFKSNFINMEINYFKPDYIYNLFDNFPPNIISSEKLTITTKPILIFQIRIDLINSILKLFAIIQELLLLLLCL